MALDDRVGGFVSQHKQILLLQDDALKPLCKTFGQLTSSHISADQRGLYHLPLEVQVGRVIWRVGADPLLLRSSSTRRYAYYLLIYLLFNV
jgi:hypothetical protein